jgi:predicted nucleic acid-binding Zn ribbon protein
MSELEPLGESLEGILRRMGVPSPTDLARVTEEWSTLVPEPFAGSSRPAGLSEGILTLEVPDGMSASLLRYRNEELIAALERHLGPGIVAEVRIRVRRPQKGL